MTGEFMTIVKGDVLFSRGGEPLLVKKKNASTGDVEFEGTLANIQLQTKNGLKNGLNESQSAKYSSVLDEVRSEDKKEMIRGLYEKIQDLKKNNADPRIIRYLNGELQYMMTRERFQPETYEVDKLTLQSF
jgi:hypothetical protein